MILSSTSLYSVIVFSDTCFARRTINFVSFEQAPGKKGYHSCTRPGSDRGAPRAQMCIIGCCLSKLWPHRFGHLKCLYVYFDLCKLIRRFFLLFLASVSPDCISASLDALSYLCRAAQTSVTIFVWDRHVLKATHMIDQIFHHTSGNEGGF